MPVVPLAVRLLVMTGGDPAGLTVNTNVAVPVPSALVALIVVLVGWVFFRSNGMVYALFYLKSMIGFSTGANFSPLTPVNYYTIVILILGLVFAGPVRTWLAAKIRSIAVPEGIILIGRCVAYLLLFVWCADEMAQSSYNPFIYFRF